MSCLYQYGQANHRQNAKGVEGQSEDGINVLHPRKFLLDQICGHALEISLNRCNPACSSQSDAGTGSYQNETEQETGDCNALI